MKIQTKAAILMAVALLAIFIVNMASTYVEVNRQLGVVEDAAVRHDLNHVSYFLNAEMNQINSLNLDWATWDDSYNFMQTADQAYINSNLIPTTLMNDRINLIIYADTSGRTFFATSYNNTTQQPIPIPQSWQIGPPAILLRNSTLGLLEIPEWNSVLVVSSEPILRSDGSGPPRGTLIFARLFDRQEIDLLSKRVNLQLDFLPFRSSQAVSAKLLLNGYLEGVQPLNQTTTLGYLRLNDVYSNPVAIVQLTESTLVTQGTASVLTPLSLIFTVLAATTVGIVSVVVYDVAVKPINRLRRSIEQVDDPRGAPGLEAIAKERTDEVGFVAAEIRRMLMRLHQSEAAFKRLVENIPVGFVRTTLDGRILAANPAFAELVKTPNPEALINVNIKEFYAAPEKRQGLLERLSASNGEPVEFEYEIRRRDGQRITLLGTIYQATDPDSQSRYIESISFDITQRKRDEAKLAEYATSLEQLVRQRTAQLLQQERLATIGRVAAMVAHDIRNPLTAIKLSAYYLKRTIGPNPTREELESLTAIDVALQRANSIVEDLYAYSRDVGLTLSEINLANLIEDSVRQVQVLPSVRLVVNAPNVTIQGDQNRLQRVFVNLVKNAVEAMPDGGTLTITAQLEGDTIELSFADSGPGMDPETLANVWQPFTTTKAKGMGLGLAICKRFIEAHEGNISVHSIPGHGTTILVRLPARQTEKMVLTARGRGG